MWCNIASWGAEQFKWCVKGDLDEILLPGPAKWWLEGYDIDKAGFSVPEYNEGYIIAFNLMILPKHLAVTQGVTTMFDAADIYLYELFLRERWV